MSDHMKSTIVFGKACKLDTHTYEIEYSTIYTGNKIEYNVEK